MNRLSEAIVMAVSAHGDTLDKSGELYILHPLRVMLDPSLTTEQERICAVLHDVIEDTPVKEDDIFNKFGYQTLLDVRGVSRGYINVGSQQMVFEPPSEIALKVGAFVKEKYMDFIDRAGRFEVTRKVKIADLRDNMLPVRMAKLGAEMQDIVHRYKRALIRLGVSLD